MIMYQFGQIKILNLYRLEIIIDKMLCQAK
jgi:hypothetical protein